MITFTMEEVFSSIYRAANILSVESLSLQMKFGEHKSKFVGDGHDFFQIREYDPERDSITQIQWRMTGWDKKIYVREAMVTKEFSIILLVDLSASMAFATDYPRKARLLLETVGNIGLACYHAQDPLGVIGFSQNIIFNEEPRVGKDHIYYLLEQFYEYFQAMFTEDGRDLRKRSTDFYGAFDFLSRRYTNRCFVIVISDFIGLEEFNPNILQEIVSRHEMVFLFLDDPTEFAIKNKLGRIRREDIETGKQVTVPMRKLVEIGHEIRKNRKNLRFNLESLGIDSMVLEYGKHSQRLHRFLLGRQESFRR